MVFCSVLGCRNSNDHRSKNKFPGPFYKFPDSDLRKEWIVACNREYIHLKTARVCSIHFDESSFTLRSRLLSSYKKQLNKCAVPTLHLPVPKIITEESKNHNNIARKKLVDDILKGSCVLPDKPELKKRWRKTKNEKRSKARKRTKKSNEVSISDQLPEEKLQVPLKLPEEKLSVPIHPKKNRTNSPEVLQKSPEVLKSPEENPRPSSQVVVQFHNTITAEGEEFRLPIREILMSRTAFTKILDINDAVKVRTADSSTNDCSVDQSTVFKTTSSPQVFVDKINERSSNGLRGSSYLLVSIIPKNSNAISLKIPVKMISPNGTVFTTNLKQSSNIDTVNTTPFQMSSTTNSKYHQTEVSTGENETKIRKDQYPLTEPLRNERTLRLSGQILPDDVTVKVENDTEEYSGLEDKYNPKNRSEISIPIQTSSITSNFENEVPEGYIQPKVEVYEEVQLDDQKNIVVNSPLPFDDDTIVKVESPLEECLELGEYVSSQLMSISSESVRNRLISFIRTTISEQGKGFID